MAWLCTRRTRDGAQSDLDFNAVQRGDAEMSQKLWRVVRSCVEMGEKNPIVQIHDQGAGGNCNVVKEIIYPLGAGENTCASASLCTRTWLCLDPHPASPAIHTRRVLRATLGVWVAAREKA